MAAILSRPQCVKHSLLFLLSPSHLAPLAGGTCAGFIGVIQSCLCHTVATLQDGDHDLDGTKTDVIRQLFLDRGQSTDV